MENQEKNLGNLKVAIITTSVREGRVGLDVANWALENALNQSFENIQFELVDLKDYSLPMLGAASASAEEFSAISAWKEKIASFDAYIFVMAEYNHSFTGVFKNAMDFIKPEIANKAAGFVGYGGVGGARAVEAARLMLAELQVACVQKNVHFMLAHDFENYTVFKPQAFHIAPYKELISQLTKWATALKTIR